MSMTAEKNEAIVGPRDRVQWHARGGLTDGDPYTGTVVSTDSEGMLVDQEIGSRIVQRKIPWVEAAGLRVLENAAPPRDPEVVVTTDTALPGMESYAAPHHGESVVLTLRLAEIRPSPLNPRKRNETHIAKLAAAIREHGQQTPIFVREVPPDGAIRYEIIAGECRYHALASLGRETILALNRGPLSAQAAYLQTLSENADREPLNCLEEAKAVHQLLGFGYSQEQVGELLGGKNQSWVSRTEKLLGVTPVIRGLLEDRKLDRTHAEELERLLRWPKEADQLARQAAEEELSSRVLRELVRQRREALEAKERLPLEEPDEKPAPPPPPPPASSAPAAAPATPQPAPPAKAPAAQAPPASQPVASAPALPPVLDTPPASAPAAPTPAATPTPAPVPAGGFQPVMLLRSDYEWMLSMGYRTPADAFTELRRLLDETTQLYEKIRQLEASHV